MGPEKFQINPEIAVNEKNAEKIIKDKEFLDLKAENLPVAIWAIHQKLEEENLKEGIKQNPNYIYTLKDYITIVGQISHKEYFVKIELKGKLIDFLDSYGEVLKEKISELNLDKSFEENYKIEEWSQDFFVIDEEDRKDGMNDEDVPTIFMHDRKIIVDGESNF